MTEASALSPFMKDLRVQLPGAMVFKHRDASMIGLPDASITHKSRVVWFEAKLYALPKDYMRKDKWELARDFVKKAQKESPTQAETLRKLNNAALGLYVIFVKKSFVAICDPELSRVEVFKTSKCASTFLAAIACEPEGWFNRTI